jgi:hypothetical protein
VAQPEGFVTPLGEGLPVAEPQRQAMQDVEVVLRRADGFDRPLHRDHEAVARRRADVVAFERRRRRQHDVRKASRCLPPRLVHDDRFRALPASPQPVEVLVVVERVAAGPMDEAYVWIAGALAVEVVARAGV